MRETRNCLISCRETCAVPAQLGAGAVVLQSAATQVQWCRCPGAQTQAQAEDHPRDQGANRAELPPHRAPTGSMGGVGGGSCGVGEGVLLGGFVFVSLSSN
jgi:hypothetical protein